ncbi:MAG TPA: heme o synthase [Polyangiaceae bacterium]|nr:heme o synthase [Polyangiaceae bacterium]
MRSVNVVAVSTRPESTPLLVSLIQLTKPGVTGLVMITALCGALVTPGPRPVSTLLIALFGTALVVGAANTFNMYLERHSDALMTRTRLRPLPTGRLSPEFALGFGLVLAAIGLPLLALVVNTTAALLTAVALGSYVLVYTPLKQTSPMALWVGAVPGAIPPLIGWASVRGSLGLGAWLLFLILFVWQLPHFLAIAIFRREEYARAGHRVLPVVKGVPATKRAIVAYSALLLLVSIAPFALHMASLAYLLVAGLSGALFLAYALKGLAPESDNAWAKRLFRASIPYLVLVMGTLVCTSH